MTDKIYVRGFPQNFTEIELKAIFSKFGKVKKSYIIKKEGVKPIHYGYVRFTNPEHGALAIETLHNQPYENGTWYVARCERGKDRINKANSKRRLLESKYRAKNLVIQKFPID